MANTVKVGITATDEGFKSTMNQMEQSADRFGKSLKSTGRRSSELNKAFRNARNEVQNLAYAYSQLDDTAKSSDFGRQLKAQMQEALQAAGQLEDMRGDIQAEIRNIASDTMAWDATAEGIGIVSSGLQGMASIYGLLGGETEKFAQALVAVNAVQSAANTIIQVGNALQKQSALMVGLRAAKNKLFGASEVASTISTTANTGATKLNTTAKGANIVASEGQAAATKAATTAQLANNAAVLANPYVAAVAAIAALAAGIYLWVNANDDLTESEKQKQEAMLAMNEQMEKQSDEVGEQIGAYKLLQAEYRAADGNLTVMKNNMSDFDDVCKAANITLKNQADAELILVRMEGAMIKKYQAQARAAAASAAMQAEYGKVLAKVAEIEKRIASGETIDIGDLEALNIDPNKVKSMLRQEAGMDDLFASVFQPSAVDLKYVGDNLSKDMQKITELAFEGLNIKTSYLTDVYRGAQQEISDALSEMKNAGVNVDTVFGENTKNAVNKVSKAVKSTSKEMNMLLSTIEGCDNVIKKAQTDITKLKHNSADFTEQFIKLNAVILQAKQSKLALIDRSTLQGMNEAKNLAEDILVYLKEGTEEYNAMQDEIKGLNEGIYNYLKNVSDSGAPKALSETKSFIENIIKSLPKGSSELDIWVSRYREINNELSEITQQNENLLKGIEKGSITELNQQISKLKERLQNENLDISVRTEIELEIEDLEKQIKEKTGDFEFEQRAKLDVTFNYKKESLQIIQEQLDNVAKRYEYLNKLINDPTTPQWGLDQAREELKKLKPELESLRASAKFTEISEDVKTFTEDVRNAAYDSFRGFYDGIHGIYDAFDGLDDKLSNAKNGLEEFFAVIEVGFTVFDAISSFIQNIQNLSEAITLLTGAKSVMQGVDAASAATNTENAAAQTAITTAQTGATAAQAAATPVMAATALAAKDLAAAQVDLATATIASAHASIPFVGPALAAAGIGTVMGAIAAAHTAFQGLQTFSEGGIVRGSTTIGDQVIVRANAGEAIITQRQQTRLFDLINGAQTDDTTLQVSSVRIKGSDIWLSLKNYSKITGKTL